MNLPELLPADTAEKRRKQIEKAKASHLSRQLQTRLQYARLKVDHGWQKQTLNEVENLYFHHYRARIPSRRSHKPEREAAGASSAQRSAEHFAAAASATTSMTRMSRQQQQASSSASVQPLTTTLPDETDPSEMDIDPSDAAPPASTTAAEPTDSIATTTQSQTSTLFEGQSVIQPSALPQSRAVTNTPPPSGPSAPDSQTQHSSAHVHAPNIPNSSAPPPLRNPPLARSSTYPQSSTGCRGSSSAMRSQSSATSLMPGSSNVALTYDSFWSSHSATSNNYRATSINTALYSNLDNGEATAVLPNLGAAYTFSLTSPSASFPPIALATRPTLGHKPSVTAASRVGHGLSGGGGGG